MYVDMRDLQDIRIALGAVEGLLSRVTPGLGSTLYLNDARDALGHVDHLVYEIMARRGRPSQKGSGSCGWCQEQVEGDLFKHVQQCRYKFDERQAAQMKAAADRLTEIAMDLEDK